MLKAIFLDYNGTTVRNSGPEIEELISRIVHGSNIGNAEAFLSVWWKQIRSMEAESNCGPFLTEEEISRNALLYFEKHHCLQENFDELMTIIRRFWSNAPLYPDVQPFFQHCPWPVYIISNNGAIYIEKRMKTAGLQPSGLICGETLHTYKPKPDLYLHALKLSHCQAKEVIHIGDSLTSDYQAACSIGIPAILLDRENKYINTDCRKIHSLTELLSRLLTENTYMVEEIIEPDYGCEGIPDGEIPRCRVLLTDSHGNRIAAEEQDDLLYQRKINEGSRVILTDEQGILPAII